MQNGNCIENIFCFLSEQALH